MRGQELDMDDVMNEVYRLELYAKSLEPNFQADLDELIRENLIKTSKALLQEYKKKLESLTSEVDSDALAGISIVTNLIQSKEVTNGREWVENTNKKWYKPWTWFQEKGYYKTKYKTVHYVPASDLAQEFFAPIKETVINNGELAQKYVIRQSNRIAASFNKEFERLDDMLKQKLSELESYATDKSQAEKRIKETEKRLKWLEGIQKQVASILEI